MRVLARHKMRSWVARLAQVESPGRSMHVRPATCACPVRVGLAITIYIRCIYGLFGRNITKYTVIYGVYIQFWPTLRKSLARSWAKKIFDRQLQYCTTLPQELSMPLFIHCLL